MAQIIVVAPRSHAAEASVEASKVLGDYYRDLANNYFYYSHLSYPLPWPERPARPNDVDSSEQKLQ